METLETLEILKRLLIASLLGALIGVERERKHRAAGLRTHIIVSVATCLIMLVSIDGFKAFYGDETWDATRFAGQAISGIGFLGAGTILQKKDVIKGLTTAATLWLCAANGLAVGIGYYKGAVFATIICLITLINLKFLTDFLNKKETISYLMTFDNNKFERKEFKAVCEEEAIEIRSLNLEEEKNDDISTIVCTLAYPKNYNIDSFLEILKEELNLSKAINKEDLQP
ncbi:MgtC/SapB family protein [uncultured Ezakiella sp.]|uniref:MgtC/SapB family protein n=1 Tax=uncultured Ezakiella sp. TaxID=1637529 RepID=UPI0025E0C3A1|nr:MgtC/SapB family protein [uncultured Ezakiella sp.]